MVNKKGQTIWNMVIFLITFLALVDILFFNYVNNYSSSSNSNLTLVNESVDSNSGFNSDQGATSGLSNLKTDSPNDVPWGLTFFMGMINFLVILVIYALVRGIS